MKTRDQIAELQQDIVDLYSRVASINEQLGRIMDRQLLYTETLIDLQKTIINILDYEEHRH